jgi:putative Holliday junction resolvase
MTKKAARFSRQLEGRFNLPVFTANEALSSFEAEQHLRQTTKIAKHNKQEIDKMAAAIIVQSWLEQNA